MYGHENCAATYTYTLNHEKKIIFTRDKNKVGHL